MSISLRSGRRVAAGAAGTCALTGALLFGAVPAAQADSAPPMVAPAGVELAGTFNPITGPTGMSMEMPSRTGTPGVMPMWWGHHHHHHMWRHHHRGFGHHWWHPWRWFWFW